MDTMGGSASVRRIVTHNVVLEKTLNTCSPTITYVQLFNNCFTMRINKGTFQ